MNREKMISKMEWLEENGSTDRARGAMSPSEKNPDWQSVVFVIGSAEKYTDEEIARLYGFSQRKTAHYDRAYTQRIGANAIIVDKRSDGRWYSKRLTWEIGKFYHNSLDEALASFEHEIDEDDLREQRRQEYNRQR